MHYFTYCEIKWNNIWKSEPTSLQQPSVDVKKSRMGAWVKELREVQSRKWV